MSFSPLAGIVFVLFFVTWLFGGYWVTGGGLGSGISRATFKYLQYGWFAIALLTPLFTALIVRLRTRLPNPSVRLKTTEYGVWILLVLASSYFIYGGMAVVGIVTGAFFMARFTPHRGQGDLVTSGSWKRTVWWHARLVIALLIFWVSFRNRGLPVFDLYDDGPRLAAVNQFLLGGIPHKDFFIHYGVFREVVQPLMAFRIWGVSYESILRLSQVMVAMNFVLLFLICTELYESIVFAVGVGIILLLRVDLFLPERVFPLLLAVYFLIAAFPNADKNRWRQKVYLFLGGCLTLGACLYSLEIGMTLFVGVSLAIGFGFLLGFRDPSSVQVGRYYGGGFAVGSAILFLWLVYKGVAFLYFSDLHSLLFSRMGTWAGGTRSHFFGSVQDFFMKPWMKSTLIYLNFPVILSLGAITGVCIAELKDPRPRGAFKVLILASVLFVQFTIYIGRPDYIHWKNATPLLWPLMLLVAIQLWEWAAFPELDIRSKFLRFASVGCLVVPLLVGFWGRSPLLTFFVMGVDRVRHSTPSLANGDSPDMDRLGYFSLSKEQRNETVNVVERIKSTVPVNGYFFDFTNLGGYYFLTERRNPTRFGLVNYISNPAMLEECRQSLIRRPPDGILVELDNDRWVCRKNLDPLAQFLQESFVLGQRFGRFGIFVPKKKEARFSSPTTGGV